MAQAIIKEEYKDFQIGFNNSGLPLGIRNDINDLAILAHESGDESLKNLFETLPSVSELRESAGDAFLQSNPEPANPEPAPPAEPSGGQDTGNSTTRQGSSRSRANLQ